MFFLMTVIIAVNTVIIAVNLIHSPHMFYTFIEFARNFLFSALEDLANLTGSYIMDSHGSGSVNTAAGALNTPSVNLAEHDLKTKALTVATGTSVFVGAATIISSGGIPGGLPVKAGALLLSAGVGGASFYAAHCYTVRENVGTIATRPAFSQSAVSGVVASPTVRPASEMPSKSIGFGFGINFFSLFDGAFLLSVLSGVLGVLLSGHYFPLPTFSDVFPLLLPTCILSEYYSRLPSFLPSNEGKYTLFFTNLNQTVFILGVVFILFIIVTILYKFYQGVSYFLHSGS